MNCEAPSTGTLSAATTDSSATTTTTTSPSPSSQQQPYPYYRVLVEFAYKHLDFQLAELSSVLETHGIRLNSVDCQVVPLPLPTNYYHDEDIIQQKKNWRKRRRKQPQEQPKEKEEEEEAEDQEDDHLDHQNQQPIRNFFILAFPTKDALRLSGQLNESLKEESGRSSSSSSNTHHVFEPRIEKQRSGNTLSIAEILYKSVLVKSVIELWGCSSVSLEDCAEQSYRWMMIGNDDGSSSSSSSFQQLTLRPLLANPSTSWKYTVHTLGTKFKRQEQDVMRRTFDKTLDLFAGPVRMKEPDQEFVLIREIELDGMASPLFVESTVATNGKQHPTTLSGNTPPLAYYFGRLLGGPRQASRGIEKYVLRNRPYLGPTSMDAELSFVMTSLGLVKSGDVVYDPFVGTGSILLACALRGAYCIGSDIDIRVLRGKGGDQQIWKNFDYYSLPRPEIIRSDTAIYDRHFRHHKDSCGEEGNDQKYSEPLYDAIITDPPYGIRAGARKTGSKRQHVAPVREENRGDHIAQTVTYPVSDVMSDLLDVAAKTLKLNGRLVYIIPSFQNFDPKVDLPRHQCLELIFSCYQPFNGELGRRVVAMKKILPYDEHKRQEYSESVWTHGADSAEKCANLRQKILEAAKQKPGYDEKATIRRKKRKAHKMLKKSEKESARH